MRCLSLRGHICILPAEFQSSDNRKQSLVSGDRLWAFSSSLKEWYCVIMKLDTTDHQFRMVLASDARVLYFGGYVIG